MKALVKIGILSILLSFLTGSLSAQPSQKKDRKNWENKQTEWMTKELNLTEEQQAKIKDLNKKEKEAVRAERKAIREEKEKSREIRKKNREARQAELQSILTPEQYQQLKEKRSEMHKGKEGAKRSKDFHKKKMKKENHKKREK